MRRPIDFKRKSCGDLGVSVDHDIRNVDGEVNDVDRSYPGATHKQQNRP